ncbi:MAG: hypothetical protein ACRD19_01300 [Terriglobia bacterium]
MNNPERIYNFLKKNPRNGFCDDCLDEKTGVDRHEVNTIASTLALFPKEFTRNSDLCPQNCSTREKLVTFSN